MPRSLGQQKKADSAIVAEPNAQNNPHLSKVIDSIVKGYSPHRLGKANRHIRIHHTAMIPCPVPVYAWKRGANGEKVEPQLLFRAGWYLSVEEAAMVERIMKDDDNRELNEQIRKQMEEQGMEYEKTPATQQEVKVVSGT